MARQPTTEEILEQRGTQYGDWDRECEINQKVMEVFGQHSNFHDLEPGKQEALRRIVMKMARIVNGNSNNLDSWADIAGYAKLGQRTAMGVPPPPEGSIY